MRKLARIRQIADCRSLSNRIHPSVHLSIYLSLLYKALSHTGLAIEPTYVHTTHKQGTLDSKVQVTTMTTI